MAKLEKFDVDKLLFKKKEIAMRINDLKRILNTKSAELSYTIKFNRTSGEITTSSDSKQIEWTAFNYYFASEMLKKSEMKKLYIFGKRIGF